LCTAARARVSHGVLGAVATATVNRSFLEIEPVASPAAMSESSTKADASVTSPR